MEVLDEFAMFSAGNNKDMAQLAIIEVVRKPAPWRDKLRAYNIVLDGSTVGKIRDGRTLELPVSPGRHDLHLKIDWGKSEAMSFDAGAGEVVRFECEPNGSAVAVLLSVISWFRRSGRPYVLLRRVPLIEPNG